MVRLSSSSSVDTLPPFSHYSSSSSNLTSSSTTMSDIYTHEPVQDFTNPFLDFDQGYVCPFATVLPTVRATLVPIAPEEEEESLLPKKPLTRKEQKTRRGYPRGESQGEFSGQILLPSFLTRILKNLLQARCSLPTCLERERGDISLRRRRGRSETNDCLSIATTRVVRRPGGTMGGSLILPFVR